MLITTIYYIMSACTFYKLLTASGESTINMEDLVMDRVWRAPLAATFLGALLVFGFNMFSCIVLVKCVVRMPPSAVGGPSTDREGGAKGGHTQPFPWTNLFQSY
jgi:hypothetical protein